jgi:hypothetical protein
MAQTATPALKWGQEESDRNEWIPEWLRPTVALDTEQVWSRQTDAAGFEDIGITADPEVWVPAPMAAFDEHLALSAVGEPEELGEERQSFVVDICSSSVKSTVVYMADVRPRARRTTESDRSGKMFRLRHFVMVACLTAVGLLFLLDLFARFLGLHWTTDVLGALAVLLLTGEVYLMAKEGAGSARVD